MNETRIKLIESDTPQELVKLLNKELEEQGVFASPIHQDLIFPHFWYCFIYSRNSIFAEPKANQEAIRKEKVTESSTVKSPFIPNKALLEKWKKQIPTPKTLNLLISKGFSKDELKSIKTQYEAYLILKNLKEENI